MQIDTCNNSHTYYSFQDHNNYKQMKRYLLGDSVWWKPCMQFVGITLLTPLYSNRSSSGFKRPLIKMSHVHVREIICLLPQKCSLRVSFRLYTTKIHGCGTYYYSWAITFQQPISVYDHKLDRTGAHVVITGSYVKYYHIMQTDKSHTTAKIPSHMLVWRSHTLTLTGGSTRRCGYTRLGTCMVHTQPKFLGVEHIMLPHMVHYFLAADFFQCY